MSIRGVTLVSLALFVGIAALILHSLAMYVLFSCFENILSSINMKIGLHLVGKLLNEMLHLSWLLLVMVFGNDVKKPMLL
jgi:hypothetical protein